METREVLKVEHLRKAYRGQDVLKDVTFSLESGTATALVGPAGAGKTTLFRILAGMAFPDGGSVSLFGSSGEAELRKARQQAGFLVDAAFGKKTFSVGKNLFLLAGLYGKPDKRYIRHLMKRLKISETDIGGKRVSWILPDAQKRYALASALAHRPRLLILDEALTDADTEDLEPMCSLLDELREEGAALLLSGSGTERLRSVCSEVLLLNEGIIAGPTPMAELIKREDPEEDT